MPPSAGSKRQGVQASAESSFKPSALHSNGEEATEVRTPGPRLPNVREQLGTGAIPPVLQLAPDGAEIHRALDSQSVGAEDVRKGCERFTDGHL